jgi:hypothetical protein
MSHSAILAYKNTSQEKFPLILVIGREPNNATTSNNSVGCYDFNEFKKCAFWNCAFGLMANYNNITTGEIKQAFINSMASPIIFSDASPIGIINKVTSKFEFRKNLTKEQYSHQIDSIISSPIFSRVKLILLSGLDNVCYNYFNEELLKHATTKNTKCIQIPFLFGNNMPKIRQMVTTDIANEIVSIYRTFIEAVKS